MHETLRIAVDSVESLRAPDEKYLLSRILVSDKAPELLAVAKGRLNLRARNEAGNNALHLVCNTKHDSKKQKKIAVILLDSGVPVNQANFTGYTPLHYAICVDSETLFSLFLKRGADIHQRGSRNRRALHWACLLDRDRMIRVLLKRGADVNDEDEHGNTPPYLIASCDSCAMKVVVKHLADLHNGNKLISAKNWSFLMTSGKEVRQWYSEALKKRDRSGVVRKKRKRLSCLDSLTVFFSFLFFAISYFMVLLFF